MARWYTQFFPVQKTTQRWHVFHQRDLKQIRAEHWTNNQADQIKKPVISELCQYIHQLLVCFKYADRFHWPQLGMTIIYATFDVHELIFASIFSHSNSASKATEVKWCGWKRLVNPATRRPSNPSPLRIPREMRITWCFCGLQDVDPFSIPECFQDAIHFLRTIFANSDVECNGRAKTPTIKLTRRMKL